MSGGAAGADHVAVKLFLNNKVSNLKLFLPAKWNDGMYYDNGKTNSFDNSGGISNYYHKKFQNATHIHSLSEIQIAKLRGAELIEVERGFYARNALVAKSDFLLAMTFGNESQVKIGSGSEHCVKCYLERVRKGDIFDKSFHYDLTSGKVYIGCTAPPKTEKVE